MSTELPKQSATYFGPITDNSRWQKFKNRPDDIFICTPPKCGTTWTQAICAMLVSGKVDHGTQPGLVSPWIDAQFAPIEEYLDMIDAQPGRRYIKTHTPLDGIPYYPSCTYLVVVRDPRDVFCSVVNHMANMTDEELANSMFPNDDTAFDYWLGTKIESGVWDMQSLELVVHFFSTYWKFRDLPNIHLFHYSDMKRELKKSISRMAKTIDVELDDTLLDEMTAAASFDNMKQNAEQFAPESGTGMWKQEARFFANGRNEQWKEMLSETQRSAFDERMKAYLPSDQVQWLLSGDGPS